MPLTVTEWDEWGNPLSDSDVYSYMKSYSPYENVEAKHYPAILAMTSLNDTRVYYVEPAKWVAALRHTKTDGNPVLLKTQMAAGHGGVSGRYKAWKETAFQYAWLLAAADGDRYGGPSHSWGALFADCLAGRLLRQERRRDDGEHHQHDGQGEHRGVGARKIVQQMVGEVGGKGLPRYRRTG